MQTSVTENELDFSELDELIREADNQVAMLQSQIKALEDENKELLKKYPRPVWRMLPFTGSSTTPT